MKKSGFENPARCFRAFLVLTACLAVGLTAPSGAGEPPEGAGLEEPTASDRDGPRVTAWGDNVNSYSDIHGYGYAHTVGYTYTETGHHPNLGEGRGGDGIRAGR